MELTSKDILDLFDCLNDELENKKIKGELYLVGGAVMCLVYNCRPSTSDIDALFQPAKKIREAAKRIAVAKNIDIDWLNDAVKGFFSKKGAFNTFLELSNLTILTAQPEYLLVMKCLAMRIGEEIQDLDDIRFLLRLLNITSYKKACDWIKEYYSLDFFPQKTMYALEELLQ